MPPLAPSRGRSTRSSRAAAPIAASPVGKSGDDRRLFVAADQYLYALDAATGVPAAAFGEQGRLDLRRDLGSIRLTTPPSGGMFIAYRLRRDAQRGR